jgi:5-methyltetrahydropteroyltriglutamate--homocysteine methyltransferase
MGGTVRQRKRTDGRDLASRSLTKGVKCFPPERLVITTDCGFGREGLSRRIAYYKCVPLVAGTNLVRRELGLPEAHIRAADPKLYFAGSETSG